ncbi:MAG TPA: DUF5700 domain-containing putative Zn-dependent protease [Candidatus Binatia bacterium]|nr:DUF5700 domain-containing putative Zn-dependent protease [Candidatus Binatia bacterium]
MGTKISMRALIRLAVLIIASSCPAGFQHTLAQAARQQPSSLRNLVPSSDALSRQDLSFDAGFAKVALQYLGSGDPKLLEALAKSPAAAHLLIHARNFDYEVPKDSTRALVAHLLTPPGEHLKDVPACQAALAYFTGPMLSDPHWVNDTLRYLPGDFRFHGTLFLTFGYDIGVAYGNTASLNCAHSHFAEHPRELMYYAIHELHHVGFMSYQPPPRLSEIRTCRDLLHLVKYSTQLEGMAVLAAWERRRQEHALADDSDYLALDDRARMQVDEAQYFQDLHYLETRGDSPADDEAWAVIKRMSSGERLWYRVGARMAQTIEQTSGRAALISLIRQGPAEFLASYERLAAQQK